MIQPPNNEKRNNRGDFQEIDDINFLNERNLDQKSQETSTNRISLPGLESLRNLVSNLKQGEIKDGFEISKNRKRGLLAEAESLKEERSNLLFDQNGQEYPKDINGEYYNIPDEVVRRYNDLLSKENEARKEYKKVPNISKVDSGTEENPNGYEVAGTSNNEEEAKRGISKLKVAGAGIALVAFIGGTVFTLNSLINRFDNSNVTPKTIDPIAEVQRDETAQEESTNEDITTQSENDGEIQETKADTFTDSETSTPIPRTNPTLTNLGVESQARIESNYKVSETGEQNLYLNSDGKSILLEPYFEYYNIDIGDYGNGNQIKELYVRNILELRTDEYGNQFVKIDNSAFKIWALETNARQKELESTKEFIDNLINSDDQNSKELLQKLKIDSEGYAYLNVKKEDYSINLEPYFEEFKVDYGVIGHIQQITEFYKLGILKVIPGKTMNEDKVRFDIVKFTKWIKKYKANQKVKAVEPQKVSALPLGNSGFDYTMPTQPPSEQQRRQFYSDQLKSSQAKVLIQEVQHVSTTEVETPRVDLSNSDPFVKTIEVSGEKIA